jgi:ketosteroid isomerase-like protein
MKHENQSPRDIALAYVDALAAHDYERLDKLLASDVVLVGPAATRSGKADLLTAFRRLGAIHVKSAVTKVFVDGADVCVIYDLVTDTAAGAVPTVEWIHVESGAIRAIHLYYDQLPWQTVAAEMKKRAAA